MAIQLSMEVITLERGRQILLSSPYKMDGPFSNFMYLTLWSIADPPIQVCTWISVLISQSLATVTVLYKQNTKFAWRGVGDFRTAIYYRI